MTSSTFALLQDPGIVLELFALFFTVCFLARTLAEARSLDKLTPGTSGLDSGRSRVFLQPIFESPSQLPLWTAPSQLSFNQPSCNVGGAISAWRSPLSKRGY